MIVSEGKRLSRAGAVPYQFGEGDTVEIHTTETAMTVTVTRYEDESVLLNIGEQFGSRADLEEVIDFLQQVQRALAAGGTSIDIPVD